MVDVHQLLAGRFTQGVLVDEQVAVGKDDVAAGEGAVAAGFAE